MSSLLIRPLTVGELSVTPERAGWRYVGFDEVRLAAGTRASVARPGRELCAVILAGSVEARWNGRSLGLAGDRASPFEGAPAAIYAPPGGTLELIAMSASEIAIGSAPATKGAPARVLASAGARVEVRGAGAMERRIHHILMADRDAESLLLTEVVTPAGHWSSYPPHKHDTNDPPNETALEETYYFRLRDPRGFALMRVYTKDRSLDESLAVRDGDLVLVPRGYHTVSAAPGYEHYYLNVMAGPNRDWKITFDPDHERMRW